METLKTNLEEQNTSKTDTPPSIKEILEKQKQAGIYGEHNHLMLDQALIGLVGALEKRKGKIDHVSEDDIFAFSPISPPTFIHYYKNADGVLKTVISEVSTLITRVYSQKCSSADGPAEPILTALFKALGSQPRMLKIILMTQPYSFWKKRLSPIVSQVTFSWKPYGSKKWDYLYDCFCQQFDSILRIWQEQEFDQDQLSEHIRLAELWIEADAMIGAAVESLLN